MRVDAEIAWVQLPRPASWWEELKDEIRVLLGGQSQLLAEDADADYLASTRCLYALCHPSENQLLYLGKAWSSRVGSRIRATDKCRVYDAIRREHGLSPDQLIPFVGFVEPDSQSRLTHALLTEIESLLIFHIEPTGNHACKSSYRCRDRLAVRCTGDWPLRQRTFVDEVTFAEDQR